jgi:hypothetical protein
MKKIFIYILTCFFLILLNQSYVFAQTDTLKNKSTDATKSTPENLIETSDDLKSGNWQDVLTSFMQLAANDITGPSHTLAFKSTLFALKLKADSSLLIDKNYIKQKFARNFQFNFSIALDSSYQFSGFNGGFTWAILNKRDNSVVQFVNNPSQQFHYSLDSSVNEFYLSLRAKDANGNIIKIINKKGQQVDSISLVNQKLCVAVKDTLDGILANNRVFSILAFPKEFQKFISKNIENFYERENNVLSEHIDSIGKLPLVTISGNGNFDKSKGLLNGGMAELVYLQGFSSKAYISGQGTSCESDFRINISTKDTMINSKNAMRNIWDINWGLNIIHLHNKKSILELKPYIEYENIFSGLAPTENSNNFYANADLRIRITNSLWIPLTIKYDIKKGNFLGFLNLSFNISSK